MTFIIMDPFQMDVFCLLVPYPPARQQARKNRNLFRNATRETNLGDPSAYLPKAYFLCRTNAPDIQNKMLVRIMTNIDEPLDEHVRMAVETMDADIAHNFKIKNLSSSIGISRSHLTSLSDAAFGLPLRPVVSAKEARRCARARFLALKLANGMSHRDRPPSTVNEAPVIAICCDSLHRASHLS
ncbi:hypothetical protein [Azospirillum sp. TSA6c]|uniref:hypothetical protein n=1 Tax=unclassified Azospirillum TaxID=2630922 RepID=UPI0018EE9E31|nr:hypothetical protein [Azospirillum sp. TSA6c]